MHGYGSPIKFFYVADTREVRGRHCWNFVSSLFSAFVFQHWMEETVPTSHYLLVFQDPEYPSECQLMGIGTQGRGLQCIQSQLLDQLFGHLQPFPVRKRKHR